MGALDPDGGGLEVQRVLAGLEEQRVHAAFDQRARLAVIRVEHLLEGDAARNRDGPGAGAHAAQHEARSPVGGPAVGGLASQPGPGQGDLVAALGQAIFGKHIGGASEGIG